MSYRESGLRSERRGRRGRLRRSPALEGESWWIDRKNGQIPRVEHPLVTFRGEENGGKLLPRWLAAPCCFQKAPRRMLQ